MALLSRRAGRPGVDDRPREVFLEVVLRELLEVSLVVPGSSVLVESVFDESDVFEAALVGPLSEGAGFRAMSDALSCGECPDARAVTAGDATPRGGNRACDGVRGGHGAGSTRCVRRRSRVDPLPKTGTGRAWPIRSLWAVPGVLSKSASCARGLTTGAWAAHAQNCKPPSRKHLRPMRGGGFVRE